MHLGNIKRKERIQNYFSKPKEAKPEVNDRNIKGTIPLIVIQYKILRNTESSKESKYF